MNRNTESHFSLMPSINISRSRFSRAASVKTTFDAGRIVPFYLEEVLPGDTFNVNTSKVVRMQTLLTPVMDNIYLDTYYFFVPNRLVWEHAKQFFGENTESAWIPPTEYTIPQITSPANTGWSVGTIADYFGVPTGVPGLSVNALPFRAYALVMNEWFRDQNLSDPLVVPMDDSSVSGVNSDTDVTDVAKGGMPYKAAKYHDYFTSALPAPQKGPDVQIPVAAGEGGNVPVVAGNTLINSSLLTNGLVMYGDKYSSSYIGVGNRPVRSSGYLYAEDSEVTSAPTIEPGSAYVTPANLYADLSSFHINAGTINQLRLAFQTQKYYEKLARSGSRYTEYVRAFFGVTSPDARLQRPEYLGGNRVPININQIVQQSGTESTGTPQGTVVGMSQTTDTHSDFTKSFTEHGYIIGVMVARYDHTYQQGLPRLFSRKDKFDFYNPVFANIGEQAIKNKEIYAQGNSQDDEVFGYQEAWAEYRYKPNIVTGEMRSTYAKSLDVWHLGDHYSSLPHLSDEWIREDKSSIDRVLAVSSNVSHQFFADIFVNATATRPMPLYSIPGLIDHH